jgi:molybdopterin-guanine dinucleotide biosynthesis protein A
LTCIESSFLINYHIDIFKGAIIPTGGANRRLQSHKGLAVKKRKRVIVATLELLKKHFNAVHISTNAPEFFISEFR